MSEPDISLFPPPSGGRCHGKAVTNEGHIGSQPSSVTCGDSFPRGRGKPYPFLRGRVANESETGGGVSLSP